MFKTNSIVLQYFGIATSQSIAKSQSIARLIAKFSSIAKSIAKLPSIAKSIAKSIVKSIAKYESIAKSIPKFRVSGNFSAVVFFIEFLLVMIIFTLYI